MTIHESLASMASDEPADRLSTYNAKRDFRRTREPPGQVEPAGKGRFVVQKHAATRLHYDFRLELDGVLLSWAVTRGPSLDPAEKRLAVRTEDHPVSYGDFEGTIPEGSYGAGTVMLWDRGTWIPDGDPRAGLEAGKLRFHLRGERMRGAWMLIRMRSAKLRSDKRENWLLRKLDDAEAGEADSLTATHVASVKTGRSMEAIAGRPDPAGKARDARAPRPAGREAAAAASTLAKTQEGTASRARTDSGSGASVTVHGIRISSPDREPYPDAGVSKRDLVAYYERVADRMLPHLRERPLTLIRCPRGVGERCFVQQHAAAGFPDAIRRVRITETSGAEHEHVFVEDIAGILACLQLGVLEFHGWGARAGALEAPDRLVFDLDPDPSVSFGLVVEAARLIRDRLGGDGIAAWPMLSGGKGIHVVVPLAGADWPAASGYAKRFAQALAADAPERFTAEMAKADRAGRIFVDYLRNERGLTAVMPFSTRAKPAASVAMPVGWDDLDGIDSAQAFTVARVLEGAGLPATDWAGAPQRLPRR